MGLDIGTDKLQLRSSVARGGPPKKQEKQKQKKQSIIKKRRAEPSNPLNGVRMGACIRASRSLASRSPTRFVGAKRRKALDGLQILIWVPEGVWPQGFTKGAVSLHAREASAANSLEAKPPLKAQVKGVQMGAFRTLSLKKGPMPQYESKTKKASGCESFHSRPAANPFILVCVKGGHFLKNRCAQQTAQASTVGPRAANPT